MSVGRLLNYCWWVAGLLLVSAMIQDFVSSQGSGFVEEFWSIGALSSWLISVVVVVGTGMAMKLPLAKARTIASISICFIFLYVAFYQALTPPGHHLTFISLYQLALVAIGAGTLFFLWTTGRP